MLCDEAWYGYADGGPRLHDAGRVRLPFVVPALPPFLADQRNEAHVREIFSFKLVFAGAQNTNQFLRSLIDAHGDHHATANLQLVHQRLGNIRSPRRDEDRVERRLLDPPLCTVGMANMDILASSLGQILSGLLGKLTHPLDGEDLPGDLAKNSRRVARTCADLQDFLAAPQPQRLHHKGHDIGLRDRLARSNGKRRVAICFLFEGLGYK